MLHPCRALWAANLSRHRSSADERCSPGSATGPAADLLPEPRITPAGLHQERGQGRRVAAQREPLERGTRFLFELTAESVTHPVEVLGEVVDVRRSASGEYFLNIRYVPGRSRKGLDAALMKLFEAHRHEKMRRYPRVPVHLKAQGTTQVWSVRDLSRGGAGVELEQGELPRDARLGVPVLLELALDSGRLLLHGAVVWATGGTQRPKHRAGAGGGVRPAGNGDAAGAGPGAGARWVSVGTVGSRADVRDGCGRSHAVARWAALLPGGVHPGGGGAASGAGGDRSRPPGAELSRWCRSRDRRTPSRR